MRLRLANIDTAELRDPDPAERAIAKRAKDFVSASLSAATGGLTINTIKDRRDKYGRYLALVANFPTNGAPLVWLNDEMVAAGLAVPYMVGG